jgi:hypothetical protein
MADAGEGAAGGTDQREEVGAAEGGGKVVSGDLRVIPDERGLIVGLGENLETRDGLGLGEGIDGGNAEDAEDDKREGTADGRG